MTHQIVAKSSFSKDASEYGATAVNDSPQHLSSEREFNYPREILLTQGSIALTLVAWVLTTWETFGILTDRLSQGVLLGSIEQAVFIVIINLLIYGNFVYQFTRLGYLKRRCAHRPVSREEMEAVYARDAAPLTILVPSYKEELNVVMGTLLSAALQDYPNRRVVLLIDDPCNPKDPQDKAALEAVRKLPLQIQAMLESAALRFKQAQNAYFERTSKGGTDIRREMSRLAGLYREAANWYESRSSDYPVNDHADGALSEKVLNQWADILKERALKLEQEANSSQASESRVEQEYHRLAALFKVELTSFERKRYVNLSHESNKAMNLNSYIGLIGRSYREVIRHDGLNLEEASAEQADFSIPQTEFILTLDADSLIMPDYALRLTHFLNLPENARVAVAQTPYSAFSGAPGELERIAGATTDIQYLIHQGFTQYGATFWVGANALLRMRALNDIRTITVERGYKVAKYIQDRTVIEDTESSVDLVDKGWTLYNYPERLAFSATPPDFGSLLIQRRRWANGGLIILPKLMRYLARGKLSIAKLAEGFFRVHYLGSIAVVNAGLLVVLFFPFEHSIQHAWLPLTAVPYFLLYTRDLRHCGYRISDMVRVYALNLLMIPINLGGVAKSIHQAFTGKQIPFGRTPKITGRTAAPRVYVMAVYFLLFLWIVGCAVDVWNGRWIHAMFGAVNALLLGYAIVQFIGIKASMEDMQLGLNKAHRLGTRPVAELPKHAPAEVAVSTSGATVAWLAFASRSFYEVSGCERRAVRRIA